VSDVVVCSLSAYRDIRC